MTVKQALERCVQIKNKMAALEAEKAELESKIKNYMQKRKYKSLQGETISVQFVQVDKLVYSIDNMLRYLPNAMVKQLTDKQYEVDGAALAELIKDNPELKSKLKQVISVNRVPNKKKIEAAFKNETLAEKDVLRFTTINSSSYLKYKGNCNE